MKKKIVAIVVLMLVATTVASATNINMKENSQSTSSSVDVPVWENGDSWTYQWHELSYRYDTNGTLWYIMYHNCTMTMTITDTTGNNYTMEWTSTNNEGRVTIASYHVKFTPFTKYTGDAVFRKTDLACYQESRGEKGFVFWLIGNIIPIPAQYMRTSKWIYTTPAIYLPFPMSAGTTGTFPGYPYTYQEKCSLYWGLIKLYDWPVKNHTASPFNYKVEMTNITVPKGTYNAYNVSIDTTYGLGHYHCWRYYVPEVGSQAKLFIHSDWDASGKPGYILEWDLISTTYTP